MFINLRIGNISSGNLEIKYNGINNIKSKCASILGAANSEFSLSGMDSPINIFNDVSVGNISCKALAGDIGSNKTPIKSEASLYITIIRNGHDRVMIDERANGSTAKIFDNLKIVDINTYEINAGYDTTYNIHSSNTSIFGTTFSKFVLKGKINEINYSNCANIGNIGNMVILKVIHSGLLQNSVLQ
jgi:hypothetical protein